MTAVENSAAAGPATSYSSGMYDYPHGLPTTQPEDPFADVGSQHYAAAQLHVNVWPRVSLNVWVFKDHSWHWFWGLERERSEWSDRVQNVTLGFGRFLQVTWERRVPPEDG